MLKTVAAVLFDDVAPFEFGVVCEVFGVDRTADGVPAFDFLVCGEVPGKPLSTAMGFQLTPEHGLDALDRADLVAVPAHKISDPYPESVVAAIRRAHERGAILLSVCTGAFILGAAGVLDGRACTTHWYHAEEFAKRFPLARTDPDVLFVDDGDIVTSAGTAAGIDACLHLVRRELGSATATAIARRMVVPPQRDGGQRQYVDLPVPDCNGTSLQPVLTWMVEHLQVEHTIPELAKRAVMSERTFARRFVAETGTTPHKWLSRQRVLYARELIEESAMSLDEIAFRCGFGTATLLRHHFQKIVGVSPNAYRKTFANCSA
jgi:transcriptional regulator GlxA family with amidase domain